MLCSELLVRLSILLLLPILFLNSKRLVTAIIDRNRYDLDFSGSFWPLCSFARGVGLLTLGRNPQHGEEDDA
jgi:hypothetical protein